MGFVALFVYIVVLIHGGSWCNVGTVKHSFMNFMAPHEKFLRFLMLKHEVSHNSAEGSRCVALHDRL